MLHVFFSALLSVWSTSDVVDFNPFLFETNFVQQLSALDVTLYCSKMKNTEQWDTRERNKKREVQSRSGPGVWAPDSITERRQCTYGSHFSCRRSPDIDTLPGISWQLPLLGLCVQVCVRVCVAYVCAEVILTLCREKNSGISFTLSFSPSPSSCSFPLSSIKGKLICSSR